MTNVNVALTGTSDTLARELIWWTDQNLAELSAKVDVVVNHWRAAWIDDFAVGEARNFTVCSKLAHIDNEERADGYDVQWRLLSASESEPERMVRVWYGVEMDFVPTLASILFGSTERSVQSRGKHFAGIDIAETALSEFLQSMKMLFAGESRTGKQEPAESGIPAWHGKPWSGAVRISVPVNQKARIVLHVGPDSVRRLISSKAGPTKEKSAPTCSLAEVLKDQKVSLQIEFDSLDISLGELQSLATGDVLLLGHPLTQPLRVKAENGGALAKAYLGKQSERRAIELIPL